MNIADRLPTMTLPELTQLQENAVRLAESGSARQKSAAAALLPLLAAQIATRPEVKKRVTGKADGGAKPKIAKARAPKTPKSASEKADDFVSDVAAAIARR